MHFLWSGPRNNQKHIRKLSRIIWKQQVFFPNILKMRLFTVMLKDNIDLNSKSNFIRWHYHGTSRSMIQFKSNENEGTPFQKVDISKVVRSFNKSKKLSPLPSEYTTVKDLFRDRTKNEILWAPLRNENFSDITDFQELDSAFRY